MGVSWTTEQQQVIDLRNRNILVSAAAGSGKTAVLVERIVKIITDKNHPVDIDHLLIVTFTNAAAAEMRERIGNAIEKALDEQPGDEHLLRQLTLIHNAQITTIDSFCLYVVRNHFRDRSRFACDGGESGGAAGLAARQSRSARIAAAAGPAVDRAGMLNLQRGKRGFRHESSPETSAFHGFAGRPCACPARRR